MTTIGFIGMTHLGLVSATAVCDRGFRTICLDPDAKLIDGLRAGQLPVEEPGLADMLAANGDSQEFTSDWADLARCDVAYISADVPTDNAGRSDLTGIRALVDQAIAALSPRGILVVLCQVPPGFTRALPLATDRLFYQVETLVFGRAVERASQPERYIVGCAEPKQPLPVALAGLLGAFDCPILPMRYESAELAKISINMCLVASISVANTMAEICEHVGADWSEIAPSLKLDRRIGQYSYLSPGLGIAGGNLERDLSTVMRLAEAHGADAGVVAAQIANSQRRKNWAADAIRRLELGIDGRPVGIWGLTYKENTHSLKNSPSLHTIGKLPDRVFRAHDPAAELGAGGPGVERVATPLDALDGACALAILTPWPMYKEQDLAAVAARLNGDVVIDPNRVLAPDRVSAAGLRHITLGVGEPSA